MRTPGRRRSRRTSPAPTASARLTYRVWWLDYDDAGRVRGAEFGLDAGGFNRWSYIYDRGNLEPKESDPAESVYTQINDDWWFWWQDWN